MKTVATKKAGTAKAKQYTVTEKGKLLDFLLRSVNGKSKTTVKSYLTHRQVSINNLVTTQFDAPLKEGDIVRISGDKGREEFRHPMLRIVFEDDHLIVIDKKYGLLSIATDKETSKTAYHILSQYVKRSDPRNMIFVLHRLDRETSGLMVFAKSQQVQAAMQENWNDTVLERKYYAVIEGAFSEPEGTLTSYLAENKVFKVYATTEDKGKIAITNYKTLKTKGDYSLMELELGTGRKNQIRAQMEAYGHSIAGDKKYGAASSPIGRIALHAGSIMFAHPVSGEVMKFESPLPFKFQLLF